ncbi:response regulator transcription factor [Ectothiorhodospiraceae bacterium WFHF3C12]|nr:response regulator transcription factor [Ectothiorhodospiraceae bacterium WFHF3C12]
MVLEGQNHILTEDDRAWPRFVDALRAFLDGDADSTAQDRFPDLTRREREVLCLVAQGCTNPEIATELDLRPKTVRNHVSSIIDKLGVAGRSQAIVEARRAGLE